MPQIVTCPDCGRKLKVRDELIGKKVKCPGCEVKFVAESEDGDGQDDADDTAARGTGVTTRSGGGLARRRDEEDESPKSRRGGDEEEDEDRRVSKRRRDEDHPEPSKKDVVTGWERVRFGINLVITALWILVGTAVTAVLGWLLLILFGAMTFGSMVNDVTLTTPSNPNASAQMADDMFGRAAGTGMALMVGGCLVGGLVILLSLAYMASKITGYGFCMGVASTRKTQALKGLAIAVFSVAIAGLLLPMFSFGGGALFARSGGACLMVFGYVINGLLVLAEIICFLLFLRGVAAHMKKEGLAQNIVFYMIALPIYGLTIPIVPVLFAFGMGATFLNAASSNSASAAAGNAAGGMTALFFGGLLCVGLEALIGLALFIWYMVLLYQVRSAVDGWLDRN